MADAAYITFFSAVFIAGASLLHLSLLGEWPRISAAWKGEPFEEVEVAPTAGQMSVSARAPMLEPVAISICRL